MGAFKVIHMYYISMLDFYEVQQFDINAKFVPKLVYLHVLKFEMYPMVGLVKGYSKIYLQVKVLDHYFFGNEIRADCRFCQKIGTVNGWALPNNGNQWAGDFIFRPLDNAAFSPPETFQLHNAAWCGAFFHSAFVKNSLQLKDRGCRFRAASSLRLCESDRVDR